MARSTGQCVTLRHKTVSWLILIRSDGVLRPETNERLVVFYIPTNSFFRKLEVIRQRPEAPGPTTIFGEISVSGRVKLFYEFRFYVGQTATEALLKHQVKDWQVGKVVPYVFERDSFFYIFRSFGGQRSSFGRVNGSVGSFRRATFS